MSLSQTDYIVIDSSGEVRFDGYWEVFCENLLKAYLISSGVSTSFHMPNCVSFADIDWPGSNRAPGESLIGVESSLLLSILATLQGGPSALRHGLG